MNKTKIAINGFGRIGRNAFKIAFERPDLEIVAVNDLSDTKTLAHLLKHDSNYGEYHRKVGFDEQNLLVEDQKIKVLAEKDPAALPWKDLGVDIVIESTGLFVDPEKAKVHIDAGAKKIIISAPAKGDGSATVVLGVNEEAIETAGEVINNGSCTTNCVAPVMAVLEENFGIEKAMMTTIHSYTASQRLQDAPAKDLREARNAASNIVPTTTGASISVAQALPVVEGIFEGLSIRVPTPVVSLIDMSVLVKKDTTVNEVNEAFKKAAAEPYFQGILAVSEEPLVSTDYIGNSHSAIVDLELTHVVTGNFVKVVAWYDNEWGYCNRLVELTADVARQLPKTEQTPQAEARPQGTDDKGPEKKEEEPLLEPPHDSLLEEPKEDKPPSPENPPVSPEETPLIPNRPPAVSKPSDDPFGSGKNIDGIHRF
ncbi:type I glyceraldehyde-3-phosphate dehydrogenase [Candidatus Saccharibacteria bacterium]|nr:type I glyceraldehyde-3-phosphate dehydrogenase [Candidatus Saccharibacteria bacterium]